MSHNKRWGIVFAVCECFPFFDGEWAICLKVTRWGLLKELMSGRNNNATCVLNVRVINLRKIALSPTVIDSNTLSTITINIHQKPNIFPSPWYRPMGIKLFICLFADWERNAWQWKEEKNRKLQSGEKNLLSHYLFISHMTNMQLNKQWLLRLVMKLNQTDCHLFLFHFPQRVPPECSKYELFVCQAPNLMM